MRCLYLSWLVVLPLFSIFAKTTVIKGQIKNYPLKEEASLAVVSIDNLQDELRQIRREIQHDGSFEIEFELRKTLDLYLRILNLDLRLLMVPGDTLELGWDYEDGNKKITKSFISYSGDGAERNRHMAHMMYRLRKEVDFSAGDPSGLEAKFRVYSPYEFLKYRMTVKAQEKKVLEGFLSEKGVKDTLLLEWVKFYIDYQPLAHLLTYQIWHAQLNGLLPKDVNIPESYYGFLRDVEINNKRALICSSYIKFLSRFYYVFKYDETPKWPPFYNHQEGEGMASAIFHALVETTEGFAREVVLSRFMYEMLGRKDTLSKQIPPLMEKYYNLVTDRNLSAAVTKRFRLSLDQEQEILLEDHISLLRILEEDQILPSIFREFSGKVIYIDIWATWCTPCLMEMDFYPKLINKFRDQEIAFVFLAAFSPEKLWKEKINDLELGGHHYLLDDKDYYDLEQYVELKGFPQHIIIDKGGKIVDATGPKIGNAKGELSDEILYLINDLLGSN